MERWIGQVAVVTGASAGIGAAITESLVSVGLKVVGIARRINRLEDLTQKLEGKPGKLYPIQADVSIEEEIIRTFGYIKKNIGPISILINNAGVIRVHEDIAHGSTEVWKEVFGVNVFGLLVATREAIKSMEESNIYGHIIHINSTVGHQVVPLSNLNVYPATKFAVRALAETLRLELDASASKIKVTDLSPGVTKTEIRIAGQKLEEESAGKIANQMYESLNYMDPEDVAEAVLYVLGTKPHVQVRELIIANFDLPKRDFSQ